LSTEFGGFDLDVCAMPETALCRRYCVPPVGAEYHVLWPGEALIDGLAQPWSGKCWMNPPYGRAIVPWIQKAYRCAKTGDATVVCLLPARTDTAWWHDYVSHGEIRLLRGRLKFGDAVASAPFPSAIVVFRPDNLTPGLVRHVRYSPPIPEPQFAITT